MPEDMAKVISMHMYTKVERTVFGVRVRCECGATYGSGFEPPADLVARHIAGELAKAGYGKEAGGDVCPFDCDSCHDPDCPCDRMGCEGSGVQLDS